MRVASFSSGRSVTNVSYVHIRAQFPVLIIGISAHISWLSEEFSKAVASISSDVDVSLTAFVTSDGADDKDPRHELDDDSSTSSDPEKDAYDEKSSTGSLVKGLSVSSGRPDIYKILEDAVTKSSGPVSVDGEHIDFDYTPM